MIVGVDETAGPSIMGRAMRGAVVSRRLQKQLRQEASPSKCQLGRTALMAAVCSNAALQPHLPQVWLPRTTRQKQAAPTLQAVFAREGAPHEA